MHNFQQQQSYEKFETWCRIRPTHSCWFGCTPLIDTNAPISNSCVSKMAAVIWLCRKGYDMVYVLAKCYCLWKCIFKIKVKWKFLKNSVFGFHCAFSTWDFCFANCTCLYSSKTDTVLGYRLLGILSIVSLPLLICFYMLLYTFVLLSTFVVNKHII